MRYRSAGALALAAAIAMPSRSTHAQATPASPALIALVTQAAAYVDAYEHQLSTVVAEETYDQSVGSDTDRAVKNRHQQLHSDLMLVDLGDASWVQFRDTYAVDGTPIREHEARLEQLFLNPSADALSRAQRVADESASHNLGVDRNINVPTMALTYLSRRNVGRSAFRIDGPAPAGDPPGTILSFKETARPPLIQISVGTLETSGRYWIAPDTGAIRRSELSIVVSGAHSKGLKGRVIVNYERHPQWNMLVPTVMDEEYDRDSGEIDRGHATYTNLRRFTVDVSTFHKGGG
jgi:hypothetical protein